MKSQNCVLNIGSILTNWYQITVKHFAYQLGIFISNIISSNLPTAVHLGLSKHNIYNSNRFVLFLLNFKNQGDFMLRKGQMSITSLYSWMFFPVFHTTPYTYHCLSCIKLIIQTNTYTLIIAIISTKIANFTVSDTLHNYIMIWICNIQFITHSIHMVGLSQERNSGKLTTVCNNEYGN